MVLRKQWLYLAAALVTCGSDRAIAQGRYPSAPYGYQIGNGQIGQGYGMAYGFNNRARVSAGTVTNYQPLINAITTLPGWNAPVTPSRPVRPHVTMSRDQLLTDDGKILWPSAAPDDPARKAADDAVRVVVHENQKYGHATVRHVVDARNKLNAFAGTSLASLKARNAANADELERFIVELRKTLAIMAVNY